MSGLRFPYDSPRPGQEQVSTSIIEAAMKRRPQAVEAPNGFGKTAAALAALATLVREQGFSCIYAVRTKREMERVLAEAARFEEGVRVAPILSMVDGCLLKEMERVALPAEVLPNYCRGSVLSGRCFFYDSMPRVGRFVPASTEGLEGFIRSCATLRVCPYFLGRDRAADSEIVVTTFPHVLNEALRSQLLGMRKDWKKELVVFDEAHNLPEAIYLSAGRAITAREIERMEALAGTSMRREELRYADKLRMWMRSLGLEEGGEVVVSAERAIESARLRAEMETLLISQQRRSSMMFVAEPLDAGFLFRLRLADLASSFARAQGRSDSRVIVRSHEGDVSLSVRFLDVGGEFSLVMKGLWSPVFLSATFFDFRSFARSLGVQGSSFLRIGVDPLERRCLTLVDVEVTTEYRRRTREEFRAIARRLANVARAVRGGTACFFPSYEVMEAVHGELLEDCTTTIYREERSMTPREQEEAVKGVASGEGAMLFGVMGGKFSEGEDFSSGSLSAVVVVGLPLPPPSEELAERMAYKGGGEGPWIYDSLVIVPAVGKVVQAAGRLFRRKGQKGVVVLMDRRYSRSRVTELLPPWLKEGISVVDTSDYQSLCSVVGGFLKPSQA